MSDYKPALDALEKIRSDNDEQKFDCLSQLMIRACDRAAAWDAALDPYQSWRQSDQNFIDSVPSLLTSVKGIQEIADAYPKPFDAIIWRAVHGAGDNSDILHAAGYDRSTGQSGAFVRALLATLRSQLENEENPQTRSVVKGNSAEGLHLHIHGPLHFPSRIDNVRKPNARITGLQFELAFYLRRYTERRETREIRTLDRLPEYGKPSYRVIGEFLKCVASDFPLQDRIELDGRARDGIGNGDTFAKVMRENAGEDGSPVRWWGWGAPDNPLEDRAVFLLDGDTDD